MNRSCRTCKRPIGRDEGCFEVPAHRDPDGPAPGFYCHQHADLRPADPDLVSIP